MLPFPRLALIMLAALSLPAAAEQRVPANAAEIQLSFAPVVEASAPAVVNIYAKRIVARRVSPFADDPFFSQLFDGLDRPRTRVQNSLGSGVILDPDGIVVSNYHVVGRATDIRVVLSDRREFEGEILLADRTADIAVIRLRDAAGLPALQLGDSDAIKVGDLALAIGNPFGVGQTVTSGIISGLARNGGRMGDRAGYYVQTDAAINPGNSGGALVDVSGNLIGINTSILTRSGGSNGIGFAIPSNLVRQYIAQAAEGRTTFARPWIGARVQAVDYALATAIGQDLPTGVIISGLHPQSPLGQAGLAPGDVILTVGGRPVNDAPELEFRLATRGLGTAITIAYSRRGTPGSATISLEEAPDTPPADPTRIAARGPFRGLTIANINPRVIAEQNLPLDSTGVLVTGVEDRATRTGLRPGDRIARVNGEDATSAAQTARLLSARTAIWDLRVIRDGRTLRLRFRG